MARRARNPPAALAALALLFAFPAGGQDAGPDEDLRAAKPADQDMPSALPELAVMGTIPLYWGEAAGIAELISGTVRVHWAKPLFERRYRLVPLDFLDEGALTGRSRLLLAQPRGLAAVENVALDAWVRQGGHLLLFADPMMTGGSRFSIGDRRRPQDVVLLSPILTHWGLALQFDDTQPDRLVFGEIAGQPIPLNLAGRLAISEESASECQVSADAVWAACQIGKGQAVIVADAALLDAAGPWLGAHDALAALTDLAFEARKEVVTGPSPEVGDDAGTSDAPS